MLMTGTQIVVKSLIDHGVDLVFGYPGGTILPLYDELSKNSDKITHILPSHEQGASHAADGYARVTGRVGVCLATSGPGSTNLVTGIATAYMDSSPVVFITANVASALLGTDAFQEVDITGITMPITKHNVLVKDVNDLQQIMYQAFEIAQSGRPGPVLIDIPKDVLLNSTEWIDLIPKTASKADDNKDNTLDDYKSENAKDLASAAAMINNSKKPMILAGGGVIISNASQELVDFAEKIQAPVASSLMGLGGLAASHPLFVGNIGMHGNVVTNTLSAECDLLIAVGTRFNDRIFGSLKDFLPNAKVLHIDIDKAEINKNVFTNQKLIGDAKLALSALTPEINDVNRTSWTSYAKQLKKDTSYQHSSCDELSPPEMMRMLGEKIGENATVVTDVGQHQMWVALHLPFETPKKLVTSGGMGTMGFGLGAAMGAQAGLPDSTTVLVTGDGCFRMNCNELATVSKFDLPVIIVLMNNGTLGMVRQWQTLFYEERYYQTTLDRAPDFVKLAEAYGIDGYCIESMSDFESTLDKVIGSKKPAVLDCRLFIDEKVIPMVAPGTPISEFKLK